jgi:hypothetical protein
MTYELIRERKIVEIGHSFVWFSKDKRKKKKKVEPATFFTLSILEKKLSSYCCQPFNLDQ